jgi:hypothetical protein
MDAEKIGATVSGAEVYYKPLSVVATARCGA